MVRTQPGEIFSRPKILTMWTHIKNGILALKMRPVVSEPSLFSSHQFSPSKKTPIRGAPWVFAFFFYECLVV